MLLLFEISVFIAGAILPLLLKLFTGFVFSILLTVFISATGSTGLLTAWGIDSWLILALNVGWLLSSIDVLGSKTGAASLPKVSFVTLKLPLSVKLAVFSVVWIFWLFAFSEFSVLTDSLTTNWLSKLGWLKSLFCSNEGTLFTSWILFSPWLVTVFKELAWLVPSPE